MNKQQKKLFYLSDTLCFYSIILFLYCVFFVPWEARVNGLIDNHVIYGDIRTIHAPIFEEKHILFYEKDTLFGKYAVQTYDRPQPYFGPVSNLPEHPFVEINLLHIDILSLISDLLIITLSVYLIIQLLLWQYRKIKLQMILGIFFHITLVACGIFFVISSILYKWEKWSWMTQTFSCYPWQDFVGDISSIGKDLISFYKGVLITLIGIVNLICKYRERKELDKLSRANKKED